MNLYEGKGINFTTLTRNYWRVLWSYAYDVVPRYNSFSLPNDDFKVKNKFPSPTFSYCFVD